MTEEEEMEYLTPEPSLYMRGYFAGRKSAFEDMPRRRHVDLTTSTKVNPGLWQFLLGLWVVPLVLVYLFIAFAYWDWGWMGNIPNWDNGTRAMSLFLISLFYLPLCGFITWMVLDD